MMSSSKDNATKNLLHLPELVEKLLKFLNPAKSHASTIEIIPSRISLTRCGGTYLVHMIIWPGHNSDGSWTADALDIIWKINQSSVC